MGSIYAINYFAPIIESTPNEMQANYEKETGFLSNLHKEHNAILYKAVKKYRIKAKRAGYKNIYNSHNLTLKYLNKINK